MPVYSVSQISAYIKDILERDYLLQDLWVSGEVGNLSRPGSGHCYFTLRDSIGSLRCVMFRNSRGTEQLESGAAVVAHGRVSVYEARGDMQLIVDIVQPEGVGELQMKLEQLKLKLEQEGLFEPTRKRDLPEFPQRIGVVTSPTGAVWHDIQNVIGRRYPLVELLLAPAPVQGDAAAPGIVEALQAINDAPDIDLAIVGRGGGSLEDLWPFNEEMVARAIYASRVPVISAVGHETDYTIADLVADRRASTPSAAAEMAVPDGRELALRVLACQRDMTSCLSSHLSMRVESVSQLHARLARCGPDLDTLRMRVDDLLRSARSQLKHSIEVKRERLDGLVQRLECLSPRDTLRRGYAIVQRRDDGTVVANAGQLGTGEAVSVTLGQGAFEADVTAVSDSQEADVLKPH